MLIKQVGILKKKVGSKYLIFNFLNSELSRKYVELWDRIQNQISNRSDFGKDFLKIMFNSDDKVPLNKPLTFYSVKIVVRCIFEEDSKLYPQFF